MKKKGSVVKKIHEDFVIEQIITDHVDAAPSVFEWINYIVPPVVLAIVASVFYYPSLHYNFQFDDVANIRNVFGIRTLTFWDSLFASSRWIPFWLNAVNYRMGKFDPYYFRLFNIGFHILAGIFVFYVTLLALSRFKADSVYKKYNYVIAYLTSFLFLLHPVQTQTVSYVIQGRMEGLAGLAMLIVTLCFLMACYVQKLYAKTIWYFLVFASAFIGTGTKEIMVVAPFLLLVVDWFMVAQGNWPAFKKRLIFHALFTIFFFGVYLHLLKPSFFANLIGLKLEARNNIGNLLTEAPGQKIYPMHFFISQFKVIIHYIVMFFWPFNISVEYDWKLVKNFFALDCIVPLCALLTLCSVLAYRMRKNKADIITFCFLWFFIAIAPRSTIIPSSELLADYKTYMASYGMVLFLAIGMVHIFVALMPYFSKMIRLFGAAQTNYLMATLISLPVGYATYERNKVWRSSEEFWSNIIANAPGKARAYNNLAVALSDQGRMQESIPLYKKAIMMDKNYPDPRNNLAVAYSMTGKLALAIEVMKDAIRINPYNPEEYNNLASFFITQKNYDEAEKILQHAIKLRPHYGKAYYNLGKICMDRGQQDQAVAYYRKACMEADLDNDSGYRVYAQAAIQTNKYPEAIEALQKLIEVNPHELEFKARLAYCYFSTQKYPEAIDLFKNLLTIEIYHSGMWFTLGEAYLRTQQPTSALEAFANAEKCGYHLPNLKLSRIACLQQLGKLQDAEKLLIVFLQDETMPAHLKQAAQLSLDKTRAYYREHVAKMEQANQVKSNSVSA